MKRFFALVIAVITASTMSGCEQPVKRESSSDEPSMFTQIEYTGKWRVVYHNETKVMYAVSVGTYNKGYFTVLVNADGTPMLWEDDKNE